jgi:hypothetical protein
MNSSKVEESRSTAGAAVAFLDIYAESARQTVSVIKGELAQGRREFEAQWEANPGGS